MKSTPLQLGLAVGAALALAGCHCGHPGKTNNAYGEIGVIYSDASGQLHTDTNATYDFGAVFMGQTGKSTMVIKNLGAGALTLTVLSKTSGDATTIAGTGDSTPVFTAAFNAGQTLAAGEEAQFPITFNALQDSTQNVVDHQVQLLLTTDGASPGFNSAVITLKGKAVSGVCDLPAILDFGSVQVGDSYTLSVTINNPSLLDAQATVGNIYSSSGDDANFSFTPDSPRGTFTVPAGTTQTFKIVFSPTMVHNYVAFLKAQAAASCPEVAMTLKGSGVTQVLTWNPPTVDCGDIQPGNQVSASVTFTNVGNVDANLTQIATSAPAEFYVLPAAGQDPTKATVTGKGGTATLNIGCKPAVLGPRTANLNFTTNLPRQPSGAVPLKVFGGGPQIQVTPSPNLTFGTIAYFSNANPPSFQNRKLTVLNVGALTPDPKGNLYLGQSDGMGGWGMPYFDLTIGPNTLASEVTVQVPNGYDPMVGLPARIGQNSVDLVVTVTPASVGMKSATIVIHSSDPARPDVTVNVSADAELLPPCDYSVSPAALNYGLITPPNTHDLSFNIVNNSATNTCLLSNLDMAPNSDPTFSLPAGPIASYTMQPSEVKTVLVRAWPQGAVPATVTPIAGQVQFFMSSQTAPQGLVNLNATIGSSCLTIAPQSLDFGTVQKGCNSAQRTFSIYNTCASPVTINGFAMQSAAGQPAGGPNCPGASPCPEFFLTATPAIPTGGLSVAPGAAPITFQAKYSPIDLGMDQGAIAINVVQGGAMTVYLVNLKGNGDAQGLNTDTFTQASRPKADILICDDSSCSMTDAQTSLSQNFSAFLQYATQSMVDFQMAVVTEEVSTSPSGCTPGNNCDGQFVNYLNEGLILTPNTPNLSNAFAQKVLIQQAGHATSGDLEQCITTTAEAVTPPMVTGANAGFLRPDATLAVVSVSDAYDQASQPVTFFLNEFLNAKGNQSNLFTFNSIGDFADMPMTTPGCVYEANESPDNGRYLQLVASTNGVRGGVCDANWSATLQNIGKTAFGFRTNFFLNAVPDLSGGKVITVQVDGVNVPPVDSRGASVWTYDAAANSVNFDPLFVPQPGQALTITYFVACF